MEEERTGVSSNFRDILKARNITLAFEPPAEAPELFYLNVSFEDYKVLDQEKLANQDIQIEGNTLRGRFHKALTHPGSLSRGELMRIYGDQIPFFQEYKQDLKLKQPGSIIYVQQWNSYPFFGATLDLKVRDNKVIGYEQKHFRVVNKGSGKKVIPSLTALRTLIENGLIKTDETVHSIELGYYGHTYDADIQVIAPVWRITHGSSEVHYVNGITGVIEKPPILSKKE